MSNYNERLAIAARLHSLLRSKTGRITDTAWLAINADYAAEIIRFTRARAVGPDTEELSEWADKLEQAMLEARPTRNNVGPTARVNISDIATLSTLSTRNRTTTFATTKGSTTNVQPSETTATTDAGSNLDVKRYVWGLR